MFRPSRSLLLALALIGSTLEIGLAHQAARPFGNDDVVRMVNAGLSERVVLAAIEQATQVAFDTSTDGLLALKKAGVPEAVLAAMLGRRAGVPGRVAVPPSPSVETRSPAASRLAPGIYLASASGTMDDVTPLEPTVITRLRSRGGWGTALSGGIAKTDMIAEIRASRATLRTTIETPTFYFVFGQPSADFGSSPFVGWLASASSPNEFVLLQMYVERDRRELVVGSGNAYSRTSGVESENTVPVNIERLAQGVYKVVPAEPLGAGEFCWFYAAGVGTLQTGGMVGKLFDFSVTSR